MTSSSSIHALFLGKPCRVLALLDAAKSSPSISLEVTHSRTLAEHCVTPPCQGYDLVLLHLEELREPLSEDLAAVRSAFPGVPVVLLSTEGDDDRALSALEAGADEYFPLPSATPLSMALAFRQMVRRNCMEAELCARERQLSTAQRLAQLGTWEWDLTTNAISCSQELSHLFGGEPGPFLLQQESWVNRASPDATGRALLATADLSPFSTEREFTRPDGSARVVRFQAEICHNERGRADRLIGICQDITEERRAEQERCSLTAELNAQRRSLEEMVRNVPGIVWEWYLPDAEGQRAPFISEYAATMLGYEMKAWADPNFGFKITAPEDLKRVSEELDHCLANGEFNASRYRLVAADGRYVPVEVHGAVIRDENGKVTGTRGVTMDLSERQAAEDALAQSEATLRTIVENSRDVIYRFDLRTGTFEYVSPAVRTFGYAPEELLAKGAGRLLPHPDDLLYLEQSFRQLVAGSAASSLIEYRVLAKNGEYRWVSDSRTLLRDLSGNPVAVIGNIRDIVEQKLAETALENATRQLVETSRRAGMAEVASNVLHNIGNVLNSVNVSVDLLRQTLLNPKAASLARLSALLEEHSHDLPHFLGHHPQGRELPAYLVDLAKYLSSERSAMLEDLAGLTRNLEHIKGVIAMQQRHARIGTMAEAVSPAEVLDDALRINSSALQRSHVDVIRKYDQVPAVQAEKHLLLQVLVNLVSNARYALEAIPASRRLAVSIVQKESDAVVITVADNGGGIAAENMPRLFEHGFTTRPDGHGYGLHSAALAASELGGSLRASSNGPGTGATFTLILPIAPLSQALPDRGR